MVQLVIITGASRGIGAAIAIEFSRKFDSNTIFLLVARDEQKLELVKNEIKTLSPNNQVFLLKLDFSDANLNVEILAESLRLSFLKFIDSSLSFKQIFAFYNHGTICFGKVDENADKAASEFQINVVSVWQFMNAIRKLFPTDQITVQFHVNISTLLASKFEKQLSLYSTTRVARAALFQFLALEQPNLRVLNYQPGPVYTDMLKQVADELTIDDPQFKGKMFNNYLILRINFQFFLFFLILRCVQQWKNDKARGNCEPFA